MKKTLKQHLVALFEASLINLDLLKEIPVELSCNETNNPAHGDYQINIVMKLAKKLDKKPHDLACEIIDSLPQNDLIMQCNVAGPGFINIKIADAYLIDFIQFDMHEIDYTFGKMQLVVVDYSSPNLAKEMHVGHLRSTIIGDSLVRINEFSGNKVIKRNHVGDWGTQFGMLVAYILKYDLYKDGRISIKDLESIYTAAKIEFDQDEDFAIQAREYVVKLQSGNIEVYKIWQEFVEISLQHCQHLYDLLQVKLTRDDVYGESYYNSLLPKIISILSSKGLLKISQGASCVFCNVDANNEEEEQVFIVQKQDGGYLYSTTDLATLYSRSNDLKADKILYVVDGRQALHFKMLFDVAIRANIVNNNIKLEHVKFGVMCNKNGQPFKTRDGGTVKLIDLINESYKRAKAILYARNIAKEIDIDKLANHLAISAIKYSDLSKNRTSDYIFDYDQMLSFEGNTAPYILYAYTRIKSIFKKIELAQYKIDSLHKDSCIIIQDDITRDLVIHLARFPDVLIQANEHNMPHFICGYVYKLATIFMRFYEHCSVIITDDNSDLTNLSLSRIKLLRIVADTIQNNLKLLGINTVDQM
jgi:arginyl-tRNA synthetase